MLIDTLQKSEFKYEIYLCQAYHPYSIIACLSGCLNDKQIKQQLMGIDEFSGTIHKYWNGSNVDENENYDMVIAGRVLLVEKYIDSTLASSQYFKIIESNEELDGSVSKSFIAYSLEYNMNKTKVREFTYSGVQIYDSVNPWIAATPCIVNYLFEEIMLNTWTVNTVSSSLLNTYRTFDISEDTVYGVIKQIQDQWNCVFFFDTFNQTVDILDYDDLSGQTGLILSNENYLNKIENQIKIDQIVTRLYVKGLEDLTVSSHTMTGQSYIDDFSYFRSSNYMSAGLLSALNDYDVVVANNSTNFTNYLASLSTKQLELANLYEDKNALQSTLIGYQIKEDEAIKNGGTSLAPDPQTYAYWHALVLSTTATIDAMEEAGGSITLKNAEIVAVEAQLATIRNNVSYSLNFTTDELKELLTFVNEETVSFDTDDGEELLSLGTALLTVKASPPIEFNLDMIDIFNCKSEFFTWDKLVLGYKVDLMSEQLSLVTSPRVTLIEHAIDDQQLKVTVSNKVYYNDDINYVTAIFEKSKHTANTVDNERDIYKEYNGDKLNILTNTSSIDTANNNLTFGDGTVVNERGMYMRDMSDSTGQMRILGNRIVFSNDAWTSYSLGINSNGIQTDASFQLYSANKYGSNNKVTINGNGIMIYGSETAGEGLIIKNKDDQTVFNLDTSGNVVMTGSITITGGSGIGSLTDAGALATADDLDDVSDGSTYKRTTANEKTGAARGYGAIDSSGDLISRVKPGTSMGNPNVAGLYMGSDYLGFHNGDGLASGWMAYIKSDGQFKFKGDANNYIEWTGSALGINGSAFINGTISIGSGDSIFKADSNGIYLGNATFASAPFRVTPLGVTTMSGATITGGTFQTNTSGNARITITGNILAGYNASNEKHGLYIDPSSFVDLYIYKNDIQFFTIYDDGTGGVTLKGYGDSILTYNDIDGKTYPNGTWDFTSTTLQGFVAKFA